MNMETALVSDSHSPRSTVDTSSVWDGGKEMDWYSGGWDPSSFDPISWLPSHKLIEHLGIRDPYREDEETKIDVSRLSPAEFVHVAFRMPKEDGVGYEPFSFAGRRHLVQPYETSARKILLTCARQTEKSTMLGNLALAYSCVIPSHRTLYVSPSALQTKTFSNDRLKEPIETSSLLRRFTTTKLSQNVFEKQFINRSKITLRYAFLTADRTRGIRTDRLLIDELQDIISDNIPIIEHCLSHANKIYKAQVYSGTPKSLDNTIEWYRSNRSTQGEWVVPCDRCGSKAGAGRHWNVLGEANIQRKGLSCSRCNELIFPDHDDAQWGFMTEWDEQRAPFEGYRISQLMVPWKDWSDIWYEYTNTSRDKFYNEALGLSYDSGLRPMTLAQIRAACNQAISMQPGPLEKIRALAYGQPFFMGVDWGTGENSYTVITIGTYINNKLQVVYVERCTGELLDVDLQLEHIKHLANLFNVRILATDYGGGFDRNDNLMRWCGPKRLVKFQYAPRFSRKVAWDKKLLRFIANRTEVMSDVFNALKRQEILLPRWEEFHAEGQEPYATDILNIYSEFSEQLKQIKYDHARDKPDDTFHSIVYMTLGSMLIRPRPDIITPKKEEPGHPNRGVEYNMLDQG